MGISNLESMKLKKAEISMYGDNTHLWGHYLGEWMAMVGTLGSLCTSVGAVWSGERGVDFLL